MCVGRGQHLFYVVCNKSRGLFITTNYSFKFFILGAGGVSLSQLQLKQTQLFVLCCLHGLFFLAVEVKCLVTMKDLLLIGSSLSHDTTFPIIMEQHFLPTSSNSLQGQFESLEQF